MPHKRRPMVIDLPACLEVPWGDMGGDAPLFIYMKPEIFFSKIFGLGKNFFERHEKFLV